MHVLASSVPSRAQSRPAHSALPRRHLVNPATPLSTCPQPTPRRPFRLVFFAALAALTVGALAGVPLEAQGVNFSGAVVTLGSGFKTPTGVAVDANGNVFVADNGNSAVKEIVAVNGRIPASPVINTLGSGFANPFTVSVDGSGNVFLTDYGHHEVKEIVAVNGTIPPSPTIRILGSGFGFLFGSAVDGSGNVYVTDYGKNEVKKIVAVNGSIPASPKILSLGSGFNIPAGVSLDGSGNIFVGDQNNNAVKEIVASSGYTETLTVATGFSTPDGVAVDKSGDVFVANDGGNAVNEILAVNGSIPFSPTILTWGSGFTQPFDVAVDGNGNVFVADRGNNAVKEIQTAGANFGPVNVGTISSSPITMSFTFDTGGTLGSYAVLTQGVAGLDFYDAGGGTCVANTTYITGAFCTVNVKFSPLAPGSRYGAVELLSGTGTLLATGQLQGTGVGPQTTFATARSGALLPSSASNLGSGFSGPGGVAVDVSGNVFVADSSNNVVKELLAASNWTTVNTLGSGFSFPNSVAVDGGGNVYVADTYNDAVKEIVAAGGYTTVNSLGIGFSNPYGVAVDGNGNVFVADFGNGAVKEMLAVEGSIPASPTIRNLAGGLNGPDGVAVDGSGNVFVANYGDGTVMEIVAVNGSIPSSPQIKIVGSGFGAPSNLSVDGIGNVFVSDTGDSEIKEIVAAGGYTTVEILGSGFNFPEGVAVDHNGDVIVADADNNVVTLLDYADPPSLTFASTTVGSTSSDSPQKVTVSNDGNAALIFALPATGTNPSVPASFAWDPSSTCIQTTHSSPQAFDLAGGTSCTMAFDFTPAIPGLINGAAVVTDNNENNSVMQSIGLSGNGTGVTLTSPTAGSVLTGPTVKFTWGTAPGATGYKLWVGTTLGASNLYNSSTISGTSATATGLPVNGSTVYVRLWTTFNGTYVGNDYTFTASTQAAISSPTGGSVLTGPTMPFTWTTANGATGYKLWVGTTLGASNLYKSGTFPGTSATATGLPTNGTTVYVRLWTSYNGTYVGNDYTYTASTQAAISSPAGGTVLTGATVLFTWTTANGATGYKLWVGTTLGASNLYNSSTIPGTSTTATGLPTNSTTVYVRLWTSYNGTYVSADYTYTAAAHAVLTSPTGPVINGSTTHTSP